jgi:hypothetical protein
MQILFEIKRKITRQKHNIPESRHFYNTTADHDIFITPVYFEKFYFVFDKWYLKQCIMYVNDNIWLVFYCKFSR